MAPISLSSCCFPSPKPPSSLLSSHKSRSKVSSSSLFRPPPLSICSVDYNENDCNGDADERKLSDSLSLWHMKIAMKTTSAAITCASAPDEVPLTIHVQETQLADADTMESSLSSLWEDESSGPEAPLDSPLTSLCKPHSMDFLPTTPRLSKILSSPNLIDDDDEDDDEEDDYQVRRLFPLTPVGPKQAIHENCFCFTPSSTRNSSNGSEFCFGDCLDISPPSFPRRQKTRENCASSLLSSSSPPPYPHPSTKPGSKNIDKGRQLKMRNARRNKLCRILHETLRTSNDLCLDHTSPPPLPRRQVSLDGSDENDIKYTSSNNDVVDNFSSSTVPPPFLKSGLSLPLHSTSSLHYSSSHNSDGCEDVLPPALPRRQVTWVGIPPPPE